MIKIFGMVFLTISGVTTGCYFAEKLLSRVQILASLMILVTEIKTKIEFLQQDLFDIFTSIQTQDSKLLPFINDIANLKNAYTRENIKGVIYASKIDKQDKQVVCDFFSNLGKSNVEAQSQHCEMYLELLKNRLESAKKEEQQKSRLYRSLGIFASAGVVILLI